MFLCKSVPRYAIIRFTEFWVLMKKLGKRISGRRDSNPRPSACKREFIILNSQKRKIRNEAKPPENTYKNTLTILCENHLYVLRFLFQHADASHNMDILLLVRSLLLLDIWKVWDNYRHNV